MSYKHGTITSRIIKEGIDNQQITFVTLITDFDRKNLPTLSVLNRHYPAVIIHCLSIGTNTTLLLR